MVLGGGGGGVNLLVENPLISLVYISIQMRELFFYFEMYSRDLFSN